MQRYYDRKITGEIRKRLENMPVAAIIGPRQCGKTTLARHIISKIENAIYLDLEKASDLNKLRDPEAFFEFHSDKLVCLDEIQRLPDIFAAMRAVIDERDRNGQFLVLGSASPELLRQSSESLAGRISYLELTPFLLDEIGIELSVQECRELWLRGGYPRSWLARGTAESHEWRLDFIRTFLERDIPQLGFNIQSKRLGRFWQMCAHVQGQPMNSSKIGGSLGLSHHTIRNYLDIMEQAFVLRTLRPYSANVKKRLVKSPKVYIRDTGLLHTLLDIETRDDLMGHPVYGASWETFVIENILSRFRNWHPYFYRTASGAEIDLVLEKGNRRLAFECKASTSPCVEKGFWNVLEDLRISKAFVVAPVKSAYPIEKNVMVMPLADACEVGANPDFKPKLR